MSKEQKACTIKNKNTHRNKSLMKKIFFIALLVLAASQLFAQRPKKRSTKKNKAEATQTTQAPAKDTLPQRTVTVTSSFQPTLKPTTKINFSAATPAPDTTRQAL